jgi:PAS domain S-box-containing protein
LALQTYTLLIVEDAQIDRELYRRLLLKDPNCDYDLLEAESVEAGLEFCRTQSIDAILLDYQLPDGNGLEFLIELAAQSDGLMPPVVMLTGQGDENTAVRAMKLGAQDYVLKRDLTPELLQLSIRNAIASDRLRQQLAQSEDWFRASIDNMLDCVGLYTSIRTESGQISDFRIDYLNPAAFANTRMTTADIGKRLCEEFTSLRETGLFEEYCQVVETGVPLFKEDLIYTDLFGGELLTRNYDLQFSKLRDGLICAWRDVTERKQIERARIAAERDRDRFFNLSIDLLAIANFDGYFLRLNPAWEKVLGFSNTELMAQPFIDFVHPDDLASTVAAAQGISTGAAVVEFENRYRCKDGSYRWLLWNSMPDTEQNVMYAIAHDITDRKQAEQARLEAEQERDRFFNLSIDLLAIGSFDGYFTRLNPAFSKTLGFTNAELMAQPFVDFVHPEDRAGTIAGVKSLAAGASLIDRDTRYRCKDGSYRWISWTATPHAPSQVWYASGHDITERKHYEAALRASERKFGAIFDQTFELLGLLSLEGVMLEVNQTALRSIDAQPHDIVGKVFWETPWWKQSPSLHAQLKESIVLAASGEFIRYEMQYPSPSGELVDIDFSLQPVFDETGRVVTILAEGHDITDLKQTQAALEQRNRDLDSFVYIVSHDLKAPLRAVANLSEWIEEDLGAALTTANQEQMSLLRSRVHRMKSTIDGLIDHARVGRTNEPSQPVVVAQLLDETIDSLAPPPTFKITIAPNLPTLYTKRLPLAQVFANLIGNGIKHHDRIDGSLHIGIVEYQDYYEFAIADDGPGIPPEQHDRIFEIFQAMNPQKRDDSTGIGLAIVKKIVEAEGGTIRLESALGKGTTFYFTWPKQS